MDSKEKIVQTAFNLFLTKGYREVSLREIVEKVGLSKGAFYHYYKSKEELFTEVVDRYVLDISDAIYDNLPKDNLKTFITGYLTLLMKFIDQVIATAKDINENDSITYYNLIFEALHLLPGFHEKIHEVHRREREAWIEVIHNAKASGEILTDFDDARLAKLFICSNDGLGMHVILEGRLKDIFQEISGVWNEIYKLIEA
jgi:TetR/AcrR family transcriptional regulator, transcriptional repressor for nem operon